MLKFILKSHQKLDTGFINSFKFFKYIKFIIRFYNQFSYFKPNIYKFIFTSCVRERMCTCWEATRNEGKAFPREWNSECHTRELAEDPPPRGTDSAGREGASLESGILRKRQRNTHRKKKRTKMIENPDFLRQMNKRGEATEVHIHPSSYSSTPSFVYACVEGSGHWYQSQLLLRRRRRLLL